MTTVEWWIRKLLRSPRLSGKRRKNLMKKLMEAQR